MTNAKAESFASAVLSGDIRKLRRPLPCDHQLLGGRCPYAAEYVMPEGQTLCWMHARNEYSSS